MLFTISLESYHVMEYIYLFHIQSFFLLPFLYGSKEISLKRVQVYFVRLYWPFIFFTLLTSFLYSNIYLGNEPDFVGLLRMLIFGNADSIKQFTGVQIFWFLPAMFSLSIIKDIYYNSGRIVRYILILISCISLFVSIQSHEYGKWYSINTFINSWVPFSGFKAISYLVLGVTLRKLIEKKYLNNNKYISLLFISLSFAFFYNALAINSNVIYFGIALVMPVVFLLLMFNIRSFIAKFKYLTNVGIYTFPIYIIHPYIGYVIYFIITKFSTENLCWALLAQIIMFCGGYYLSILIYKFERLRKFLFPQDIKEFILWR
ncbi:MAG: hypothetical protein NC115_00210 [Bacteroidales bacterium]|nr:hypothetical protein [Bacteroidales bacterium]